MDSVLNNALASIMSMSQKDQIDGAVCFYKLLRDELKKYNNTDFQASAGVITVIIASILANGTSTPEERDAVIAVYASEGIEATDDDVRSQIKAVSELEDPFKFVLELATLLPPEGKTYLFTLVAFVCACDGDLDINEYGFLFDIFNA